MLEMKTCRSIGHIFCSLNTLYGSLHLGLPFSHTWFIATYFEILSLLFDFRMGLIASWKQSAKTLSATKLNVDYNEHKMNALFLFWKTYNLGAPDTDFII